MPANPIAALASAAEGNRELDALVAVAAGWKQARNGLWHHAEDVSEARRQKIGMLNYRPHPLPAFTTSVDAALTLVPDGMECVLGMVAGKQWGAARLLSRTDPIGNGASEDDANSLPLAICLAALRAREAAP